MQWVKSFILPGVIALFWVVPALAQSEIDSLSVSPSPSSLESALADTPLKAVPEGVRFDESFRPDLTKPEDTQYKTRFPNGTTVVYTLDPLLQEKMKTYFKKYKVPYGVFVAIDPNTGKVLAMVEHSHYNPKLKGLALRATFPAASVFKLITAAAALEEKKASPDTPITFHGGLMHLRRHNWEDDPLRDYRTISFTDALARSANVPFAKVATRWLDSSMLLSYSQAFGFNRPIFFELPVQQSHAIIPDDRKQVAYAAAGFGDVRMSPLHGALIASAIGNGGALLVPRLIDRILDKDGHEIYASSRESSGQVVSKNTTDLLKEMMGQTSIKGTSRRAFRSYYRSPQLREITIGGKTGTISGNDPPGKYSWFVGMAPLDHPEIAVAALVINSRHWRIKGSDIAKEGFSIYFKRPPVVPQAPQPVKEHPVQQEPEIAVPEGQGLSNGGT